MAFASALALLPNFVWRSTMEEAMKVAAANNAWQCIAAARIGTDPKNLFLFGFVTGWAAGRETDACTMARLEGIFTASQAAGIDLPQTSAKALHSPSSRGKLAAPAFEQSTVGKLPLPSSAADGLNEGLGRLFVGRSLEARQIQSGSFWRDRVLCSLKRAFR